MKTVFDVLRGRDAELLDATRTALRQLDPSVIEQVRMHRIVYSKGFAMRDFAELTLKEGRIVLSTVSFGVESGRKFVIESEGDLELAIEAARSALERI